MRRIQGYCEGLVEDVCTTVLIGGLLLIAGWISAGQTVYAQTTAGLTPFPQQDSIIEFALRQGGALAILLIVLFYYRRDYRDLVDYRTERDKILVNIIEANAKANTEFAEVMRENNRIVQAVFNDHVAVRNGYKSPGEMLANN